MTRTLAPPGETRLLYSPIALQLRDEFTADVPFGRVDLRLQEWIDGVGGNAGFWRKTGVLAFKSADDVQSYPGLGRGRDRALGARRFRILIDAEYYRPYYRMAFDGLEFDVYPYDDDHPLRMDQGEYARGPMEDPFYRWLLPNTRYPFPATTNVVRGRVYAAGGDQVPLLDAVVEDGISGSVGALTDEQGEFALPMRWPPRGTYLTEDVAVGDQQFRVESVRGLVGADIQIDGDPFRVADAVAGNANAPGSFLVVDAPATRPYIAGQQIELVSFALTVSPRSGAPPQTFQVPIDLAFSKPLELPVDHP